MRWLLLILAGVMAGCGVTSSTYVRDLDDKREQAAREAQSSLPADHQEQEDR